MPEWLSRLGQLLRAIGRCAHTRDPAREAAQRSMPMGLARVRHSVLAQRTLTAEAIRAQKRGPSPPTCATRGAPSGADDDHDTRLFDPDRQHRACFRRPPARSIHRRQLPVRLLLDGILLRAIGRTGRGRETSGRQLPEWLARVGQRVRPQRALTVPFNGWNRLFVVVGVVWALVAPFLFSSAVKLRISSTALAVANHKVR